MTMKTWSMIPLLWAMCGCGESAPTAAMDAVAVSDAGPADAVLPGDAAPPASDVGVDAALPDRPTPPEGEVRLVAGSTSSGFVDGVGPAARFNGVTCTALSADGRTLYASDTFNGLVRAIDVESGETTTLVGRPLELGAFDATGDRARLQSPRGCAAAPDGSAIYIADGPSIRQITLPGLEVTTLAGVATERGNVDGTGAAVRLGYLLHDLETSADGRLLYISDRSNDTIRTLEVETGAVATIAGAGGGLSGPGGLARVDDALYIADTFNGQLQRLDLSTNTLTVVADGLQDPQGVAVADGIAWLAGFNGVLYRVSVANGRVTPALGVSNEGSAIDGDADAARLGGAFAPPTYDAARDVLYYDDISVGAVRVIHLDDLSVSTLTGPVQPTGYVNGEAGRFGDLYDVATDGSTVYLADPENSAVRSVDSEGNTETLVGDPDEVETEDGPIWKGRLESPVGLAYDAAAGRLFIADVDAHLIRVVDFEARQIATFAGTAGQPGSVDGDRETARLSGPWAIDLASDGTLYVAEAESGALRAVDASGAVTTVVAPGTFEQPLGLAVDAANGRAFVADMAAPAVYTVSLDDGASEILVGQPGATGIRDGSADEALLSGPWGLAVVEGGLLIVDAENHLIRRFDFAQQRLDRWLGHPLRHGGLAPGSQVPWDEMTFERPRAVASDADTLWVVSQAALYGATAQ